MAADAMSGGLKGGAFSGEGHRQLGAGGSRKKSRREGLNPRREIQPGSSSPSSASSSSGVHYLEIQPTSPKTISSVRSKRSSADLYVTLALGGIGW